MRPRVLLYDAHWRRQHYKNLLAYDAEWMDTPPAGYDADPGGGVDVVVFSDEFPSFVGVEVPRLRRLGVPTLHQVDGVVEWRNVWENPRSLEFSQGLPLFQPILSDKVACMGAAQLRTLEPWGNAGKCELVGLPRLDGLAQVTRRAPPRGQRRILVLTARTAGFTLAQTERVFEALRDLKACLESAQGSVAGVQVELLWRVTSGLDQRLGVPPFDEGVELTQMLGDVDAVISTPSTAVLDAMAVGLPTAVIDYTNSPPYGQAAWFVTAREHIEPVLRDLVDPPLARMTYQQAAFADQLEFPGASDRLWTLIVEMARIGREARARGQKPSFPARMLPVREVPRWPAQPLDMAALYPDHPEFLQRDTMALQAEVGHLRRVIVMRDEQIREWDRLMNWRGRALRLYRRVRALHRR